MFFLFLLSFSHAREQRLVKMEKKRKKKRTPPGPRRDRLTKKYAWFICLIPAEDVAALTDSSSIQKKSEA